MNASVAVLLIVLDGIPRSDAFNPALFPHLNALRAQGTTLLLQTGNPSGVSLPGYADLFTGHRQGTITGNDSAGLHSLEPTLFERAQERFGGHDSVAVVASWEPLCALAVVKEPPPRATFYRSCGVVDAPHYRPGLDGTRADVDTFIEAMEVLERRPRLLFVQFKNGDSQAHLVASVRNGSHVDLGRTGYEGELRKMDFYVGAIVEKARTTGPVRVVVTTDHGRSAADWTGHGADEESLQSWAIVVGDGASRAHASTLAEIAVMVAEWIGLVAH